MPHTSRKKPRGQPKRLEITNPSGWTTITKGTSKQRQPASKSFEPYMSEHLEPHPAPAGLTIQKVRNTFERYRRIWEESTCFQDTKRILETHAFSSATVQIDRCVCLGLGSFTDGRTHDASMYELVALHSILELLSMDSFPSFLPPRLHSNSYIKQLKGPTSRESTCKIPSSTF